MYAFPYPSSVTFNPSIKGIKEQEKIFESDESFPTQEFWQNHAYHFAVDGNIKTCWKSTKGIITIFSNNEY